MRGSRVPSVLGWGMARPKHNAILSWEPWFLLAKRNANGEDLANKEKMKIHSSTVVVLLDFV